ncbi:MULTISPECIES: DUF3618 domain-containing protein [unclassified Leifsonia]|uniref:DUF3618 domain-containing protein n=1 Tax=unclassified Leifsonia TaxID=2663824 RepID=UPI000A18C080|nr:MULTISPECIES: DUF3618 domain-containing protein [unclassified Leifsonia]QIZ97254.1 DUF3618 domain-containing protein [Leifsonia sp. PS1209]
MTTDTSDVQRARNELAATLDAIEYKLNVPKRTAERIERLRTDNPLALVGIAVAAAAAVAGVVWLIVRSVTK